MSTQCNLGHHHHGLHQKYRDLHEQHNRYYGVGCCGNHIYKAGRDFSPTTIDDYGQEIPRRLRRKHKDSFVTPIREGHSFLPFVSHSIIYLKLPVLIVSRTRSTEIRNLTLHMYRYICAVCFIKAIFTLTALFSAT